MKIIHFCQYKVKHSNGVQVAVWELAKHQARFGHQVEIISLGRKPSVDEVEIVAKEGITLSGYSGGKPSPSIISSLVACMVVHPDVVCHVHSVFIPWHSLLCRCLGKHGIRYFLSPHGNLAPMELARKHLKKWIYLLLIEKGVLRRASGILCVSDPEVATVNKLLGTETASNLGNGVDPDQLPVRAHSPRNDNKVSGMFLGKSDVVNKGFDRMFSIAKHFSGGIDFYVIDHNQADLKAGFDNLVDEYADDSHVRVHPPVYSDDKVRALANADCYVHLPRWEVFGMAIVEAAMMGLPLVLSAECDLASEAEAAGAALVLNSTEGKDLKKLQCLVADMHKLQSMGEKAKNWALSTYSSEVVATRSIELYRA